jgi:hypothetical protein
MGIYLDERGLHGIEGEENIRAVSNRERGLMTSLGSRPEISQSTATAPAIYKCQP